MKIALRTGTVLITLACAALGGLGCEKTGDGKGRTDMQYDGGQRAPVLTQTSPGAGGSGVQPGGSRPGATGTSTATPTAAPTTTGTTAPSGTTAPTGAPAPADTTAPTGSTAPTGTTAPSGGSGTSDRP